MAVEDRVQQVEFNDQLRKWLGDQVSWADKVNQTIADIEGGGSLPEGWNEPMPGGENPGAP